MCKLIAYCVLLKYSRILSQRHRNEQELRDNGKNGTKPEERKNIQRMMEQIKVLASSSSSALFEFYTFIWLDWIYFVTQSESYPCLSVVFVISFHASLSCSVCMYYIFSHPLLAVACHGLWLHSSNNLTYSLIFRSQRVSILIIVIRYLHSILFAFSWIFVSTSSKDQSTNTCICTVPVCNYNRQWNQINFWTFTFFFLSLFFPSSYVILQSHVNKLFSNF